MKRAIETLLKIALIGIYALVIFKGYELWRFAVVKERVDRVTSISSPSDKEQVADSVRELGYVLAKWRNVTGVRSDVAFASIAIKRKFDPNDLHDLESESISILSVHPMSAEAWTLLAGARLLGGQPIVKSASALQTSLMLAPNEDDLVAERLVYGLIIWEYLSPSAKERIALDLAIAGRRGIPKEVEQIRTIVAQKSAAVREDIRARLQTGSNYKALIDKFNL